MGSRRRWSSHSPPPPGVPCCYIARSCETLDRCCHTSLPANKSGWGVESEPQTWSQCLQQTARSRSCQSTTQQDALSKDSGKSHSNACTYLREAANLADGHFALPERFECHHRQKPDHKGQGYSHRRTYFQTLEAGTLDSHHRLPRPVLHDQGQWFQPVGHDPLGGVIDHIFAL